MLLPAYSQPKDSITCGQYCLKMLLHFYKNKASIRAILKQAPAYKGQGTYIGDAAYCLLHYNIPCSITTFGTKYYTPKEFKMNQKQLLASFQKRLKTNLKTPQKRRLKSLVRFMRAGGKVKVRIPTKKGIISALKRGPVMAALDCKVLYGKGAGAEPHWIIISDYKNSKFQLHDPHWNIRGKRKWYDSDTVMFAIHTDSCGVIFA